MTIFLELSFPFVARPWKFESKYVNRYGWGWFSVSVLNGINLTEFIRRALTFSQEGWTSEQE